MRHFGVWVLFAALAPAAAQDSGSPIDTPEEAMFREIPSVYAASRYEQPLSETPASVTVMTGEEIRLAGWRTIAEILENMPGTFVTYDRNYEYLGVRGVALPGDFNTRALLLIDGHRANDGAFDTTALGTEGLLDVEMIERVELVRGPGSSVYGTNAMLCVINIVTRRGRALDGGSAFVEAGSEAYARAGVDWGRRFSNGLDAVASVSGFRTSGDDRLYFAEFDDPATNDGVAVDLDDDRAARAFLRIARGPWSVRAAHSERRKQVPTASYATQFGDPRLETVDRWTSLAFDFEHNDAGGGTLNATASLLALHYDGAYPYEGAPLLRDEQESRTWAADLRYVRRVGTAHRIVAGMEGRRVERADQRVYDVDPYFEYLADRRSATTAALFAQDEIQLHPRWILTLGARADRYDSFGTTVNPRAALIWMAGGRTSAKLLYGRAFRAPNAYESFYNDGGLTQKAASGLRPERVDTWEIAVAHDFESGLRASLGGYRSQLDKLIALTTDPDDGLLVYANRDELEAEGLELEIVTPRAGRFEGRGSWAYQHTIDGATDGVPPNSPRHVAKFGVSAVVVPDALRVYVAGRFVSPRETIGGLGAPGYVAVDASATWDATPRLGLQLVVANVLNRSYGDPGGEEHVQNTILQPGRLVRLGLRYSF